MNKSFLMALALFATSPAFAGKYFECTPVGSEGEGTFLLTPKKGGSYEYKRHESTYARVGLIFRNDESDAREDYVVFEGGATADPYDGTTSVPKNIETIQIEISRQVLSGKSGFVYDQRKEGRMSECVVYSQNNRLDR